MTTRIFSWTFAGILGLLTIGCGGPSIPAPEPSNQPTANPPAAADEDADTTDPATEDPQGGSGTSGSGSR